MAATTIVNNMTVVHKSSDGTTMTFPDVCKTPTSGGPVPIPYPNVAQSADTSKGSKKVKVDGNPIMLKESVFSKSSGDEAGSVGGVVTGKTKGKADFVNYSFDVKVEGKNVPRLMDPMVSNKGSPGNTPPGPEMQGPAFAAPPAEVEAEDYHEVQLFLRFKHPNAADGRNALPRFETPHDLKGAENRKGPPADNGPYTDWLHPFVKEGDYNLEFKFKLEKQPLKPKS